jgi:hypothetical protein
MILCDFKPRATGLTTYEQAEQIIREKFTPLSTDEIAAIENPAERQQKLLHRGIKLNKLIQELEKPKRQTSDFLDWMESQEE